MNKEIQLQHVITQYMGFLEEVIRLRLQTHFQQGTAPELIDEIPLPDVGTTVHPFLQFIDYFKCSREEVLWILIALAPHVYSDFFDRLIRENIPEAGDFPEFGCVRGKQFRGLLPTAETAYFIIAGNDLSYRFRLQELSNSRHFFVKKAIVRTDPPVAGEPRSSGRLVIDSDYIDLFTSGRVILPQRSIQFPAEHLSTELSWEDLILSNQTWRQIKEVEIWIRHSETLLIDLGMSKKLKPGYRALFYGPPGTGKTLTATLLGKYTQREVFKIDLSMVVSKYIGETEKNLATLFDKAENKDWILFFDEADAIFGKRTSVRDAHDKYANQEVSYLLQRIENYPGLTILASNFRSNIDDAFTRRFQSIIQFPMPKAAERFLLWQKAFPEELQPDPSVNLNLIAEKYELNGSNIMNVVQYCCLQALEEKAGSISSQNLLGGIKREFFKEGKTPR